MFSVFSYIHIGFSYPYKLCVRTYRNESYIIIEAIFTIGSGIISEYFRLDPKVRFTLISENTSGPDSGTVPEYT